MIDIYRETVPENHLSVLYYIESRTSLLAAAEGVAIGQTIGNPSVRIEQWETQEFLENYCAKIIGSPGELSKEKAPIDALFSTFPAGTLSGAPKPRAMEIIEELEPNRRGLYGGALGYLDFRGNIDTCIAIRTAVIKDGRAYVQAGAGIVADSDPNSENQECINKAAAVLGAINSANNLRVAR